MGNLYIALFHHSILQCGIYPPMTEKLLKLLNRHTFVDCHSSQCASELVRVCLLNVQEFTDFSDSYFHTADIKTFVRSLGVVLLNFILRRIDYDTGDQKRNYAENAVSVG